MSLRAEIGSIFEQAQRTCASHSRCFKQLEKCHKRDPDNFVQCFTSLLKRVLVIFKQFPNVERIVHFIVDFSQRTELRVSNSEPFALFLLRHLLPFTAVSRTARGQAEISKAIRFRSCQLIAGILNVLSEETEIETTMWEALSQSLLQRTMDKIPAIRAQAVAALARLQDSTNPNDPVIQKFLQLLNSDLNKEVRKAVLNSIAITKTTLPHIIKRIRDVASEVRKQAFVILLQKIKINSLTIAQRTEIVKNGLNDRDPTVKRACLELCNQWLKSKPNVFEFVAAFDPEFAEETVSQLIREMFVSGILKMQASDFDYQNNMTSELALLWRLYCEHLKISQREDLLDVSVPELVVFCQLLATHKNNHFITKQLLLFSDLLDLKDEAGKKTLSNLLRDMLSAKSVNDDLIPHVMTLLRLVHSPNENDYIRIVLETISELREPLEVFEREENKKLLIQQAEYWANLENEISVKKQQLKKKKSRPDAEALHKEIEKLEAEKKEIEDREELRFQVEQWAWLRCLTLAQNLLRHTTKTLKDAGLLEIKDALLTKGIQQENPDVRNAALETLGIYCLLNKEMAKKHLLLFVHALQNDEDRIKETALKVMFDFVMVFGVDAFCYDTTQKTPNDNVEKVEPANESTFFGKYRSLVDFLRQYLFSNQYTLRSIAVEGFARLCFTNTIVDSKILRDLMLLFFIDGDDPENTKIQQCLSVFWPAYAFSSPIHQINVASIFLDTLRTVVHAEKGSLCSKINVQTLVQFFIYHTDATLLQQKCPTKTSVSSTSPFCCSSLHNQLALTLLKEIISNPSGKECKFLCKSLSHLNLNKEDQHSIKVLLLLVERAITVTNEDKVSNKLLRTFETRLKSLDITPEHHLTPEEVNDVSVSVQQFIDEKVAWLNNNISIQQENLFIQQVVTKPKKPTEKRTKISKRRKSISSDSEEDTWEPSDSESDDIENEDESDSDDEEHIDENKENFTSHNLQSKPSKLLCEKDLPTSTNDVSLKENPSSNSSEVPYEKPNQKKRVERINSDKSVKEENHSNDQTKQSHRAGLCQQQSNDSKSSTGHSEASTVQSDYNDSISDDEVNSNDSDSSFDSQQLMNSDASSDSNGSDNSNHNDMSSLKPTQVKNHKEERNDIDSDLSLSVAELSLSLSEDESTKLEQVPSIQPSQRQTAKYRPNADLLQQTNPSNKLSNHQKQRKYIISDDESFSDVTLDSSNDSLIPTKTCPTSEKTNISDRINDSISDSLLDVNEIITAHSSSSTLNTTKSKQEVSSQRSSNTNTISRTTTHTKSDSSQIPSKITKSIPNSLSRPSAVKMSHNSTTRPSSIRSSNVETLPKQPNSHASTRAAQSTAQRPKNPAPCLQPKVSPTTEKSSTLPRGPLKVSSVSTSKKPTSGITKVTTFKPKTSALKNDQIHSKEPSSRGPIKTMSSQTKSHFTTQEVRLKKEMEALLNDDDEDDNDVEFSAENTSQNVANKSHKQIELFKTPAHLKGKNVPNSVKKRINEIEALLQE